LAGTAVARDASEPVDSDEDDDELSEEADSVAV
jgi:hypothetical protein